MWQWLLQLTVLSRFVIIVLSKFLVALLCCHFAFSNCLLRALIRAFVMGLSQISSFFSLVVFAFYVARLVIRCKMDFFQILLALGELFQNIPLSFAPCLQWFFMVGLWALVALAFIAEKQFLTAKTGDTCNCKLLPFVAYSARSDIPTTPIVVRCKIKFWPPHWIPTRGQYSMDFSLNCNPP